MYHLLVFYPGETHPQATATCESSAEVLKAIPLILAGHPGCERVAVRVGTTTLFSVDCAGNRLP